MQLENTMLKCRLSAIKDVLGNNSRGHTKIFDIEHDYTDDTDIIKQIKLCKTDLIHCKERNASLNNKI